MTISLPATDHVANFEALKLVHEKWLDLHEDQNFLRMLYGAVVANEFDGLPVWILLVAKPGAGKSELLMPMEKSRKTMLVSTLTPNALASGFGEGEHSVLLRAKGKELVIKDISSMNQQSKENLGHMFGILRDAYDGRYTRPTGRGEIVFEGKIGLIAGCTHEVESDRQMYVLLGERFLTLRLRTSEPSVAMILGHSSSRSEMTKELGKVSQKLLDEFKVPERKSLPSSLIKKLDVIAHKITKYRSPVKRDIYTKDVVFPAMVQESYTRVFQQMLMWMLGMRCLGADEKELEQASHRILIDNIPYNRASILQAVANGVDDKKNIMATVRMSRVTVEKLLEDMTFLGILESDGNHWYLEDEDVKTSLMVKA